MASPTPWPYFLIRLLFKFVLKIFYASIVVENAHLIPENGHPCILCANHTNSLTDAVLLVGSVPSSRRNFLRLTAKATQFGRHTFSSWLIEAAGTVPLKRRQDAVNAHDPVDNSDALENLKQVLEKGDAVCLFPEGFSRYHPTLAPLKTGVARLVSDVLTRQQHNPDFQISVLPCSITYMHRQHFRSDVLVTFHPPMTFSPSSTPSLISPHTFHPIQSLTSTLHATLSSGTYDAPSWDLVQCGKLAAGMYAPLGTRMGLGDYVRVGRGFVWVFGWGGGGEGGGMEGVKREREREGVDVGVKEGDCAGSGSGSEEEREEKERDEEERKREEVRTLLYDLKAYQKKLTSLSLKDFRLRTPPAPLPLLLLRLLLRLTMVLSLSLLAFPGIAVFWSPIFLATRVAVRRMLYQVEVEGGPSSGSGTGTTLVPEVGAGAGAGAGDGDGDAATNANAGASASDQKTKKPQKKKKKKTKKPAWDTWDEIAQTKLVVGLGSGVVVYISGVLLFSVFLPSRLDLELDLGFLSSTLPLPSFLKSITIFPFKYPFPLPLPSTPTLPLPLTLKLTLPTPLLPFLLLPPLMWLSLRWLEDATASTRALLSLSRLIRLQLFDPETLREMREERRGLEERVWRVAVGVLGLPVDVEGVFGAGGGVGAGVGVGRSVGVGVDAVAGAGMGAGGEEEERGRGIETNDEMGSGNATPENQNQNQKEKEKRRDKRGEKGRVGGLWLEAQARYFDVRRRRKRDWNEVLRLYDVQAYPAEDE